jgi:hypothetical protein
VAGSALLHQSQEAQVLGLPSLLHGDLHRPREAQCQDVHGSHPRRQEGGGGTGYETHMHEIQPGQELPSTNPQAVPLLLGCYSRATCASTVASDLKKCLKRTSVQKP